MNEKLLEQRAEQCAEVYKMNRERDSFIVPITKSYKDGYIAGATEETKEAREIIKDLLDVLFINDCAISSESKEQAEKFLKETK